MIHEAMGVARGRAKVRFGGENGRKSMSRPATSSSCRRAPAISASRQSPELVVIGAYPPSGKYNLCRGSKAEHAKALASIPEVPPPATDPVFGAKGPLIALWRA